MNDPEFQRAYEEQNRRDYIANATFGSIVSIPLQLSCSFMDYVMYPSKVWAFFKVRVCVALVTLFVLLWFKKPSSSCPRRLFGVTWFTGPLLMVLWMIYDVNDPLSPYYAGLNIILLAMALISSWTYIQNTVITVFCLVMYVVVSLAMSTPQPLPFLINNTTFLFLTASFVVLGSRSNARERLHEFTLRFELEKNRRIIEENNRKLVELDHAKSRFFANISHELRTPLTLLLAPLDTFRARFGGLMDREGGELIVTMRDNGMRLLKLINDLLDLVRLEEGRIKINHASVELESFIRGLASSVQHTAATREVHLSVDVPENIPAVLVDRDKLEKILLNLLFNALKFTNSGGKVALRVRRERNDLVFSVSDTGIGISEEHLGHLFQRFWQADASSHRKHQGAGIGLALVKELAEAQGGSVEVQSQEGEGSSFTVRLPFKPASEAAAEKPDRPTGEEGALVRTSKAGEADGWLESLYHEAQLSPAGGHRVVGSTALYARYGIKSSTVLVADDEPDMLRFIRAQLGTEHRIVSARNGREAVEKARQESPSVIVLDMMMPEMDGIEACEALRKDGSTAHIPIIMLTARADEDTKLAALAAGASDFLAKPFSVTELHVRVQNLMESYFSRMELAKQNQTLEDTLEMLRETEMQLLQSEKLASIGELSAGMSHEVKNPLNYALTGVYALRKRAVTLPEEERGEYEDLVVTVEEGVRRVMDTMNTLRELVHPQVENRQQFKVQDVVDAALRLLRTEWKDQMTVHTRVAPGTTLYANKSMVLLVFLNLLKNAMDAVKLRPADDGEATIWIEAEESTRRTVVRVRDNGLGIAKEHQSRVFDVLGMGDLAAESSEPEPGQDGRVFKHFFSTKAPGAGMGMGLSICRRIVRAHGGKISFRTEPGKMCEFTLEFLTHKGVEVMA